MQDAHLAETLQYLRSICPEQQREREDQQFGGGEHFFDYSVDRKNWTAVLQRATEKPADSVFIFNFAVAKLHYGKRVGAHGSPFHLRNGTGVWTGHPLTRHSCAVQFVYSANRTSGVHGSRFACILVPQTECCHLLCHVSHFMVVLSRAFFHEHFFFTNLPYHAARATQYNMHISKLLWSTSCTIKNHTGLKTCLVADTRAQQLPQLKLVWMKTQYDSSCG